MALTVTKNGLQHEPSRHAIEARWFRRAHPEMSATFCRNHEVIVGTGQRLQVSAAKEYKGDPALADPEQLLVGSLASCHMLFFLAIAEMSGYVVESYIDTATGYLEREDAGGFSVRRIALAPQVTFSPEKCPEQKELQRMHDRAHSSCFIAKSFKGSVSVAPVLGRRQCPSPEADAQ
jgi:organic hydroperoxide reductase OsmC/OhrA